MADTWCSSALTVVQCYLLVTPLIKSVTGREQLECYFLTENTVIPHYKYQSAAAVYRNKSSLSSEPFKTNTHTH